MGNNCNASLWCHVLRGKQPHVLVDPGHIHDEVGEACLDSLIETMDKDGLRITDVGLIIVTHSHPDHLKLHLLSLKEITPWLLYLERKMISTTE